MFVNTHKAIEFRTNAAIQSNNMSFDIPNSTR